ncbi:YkvA family protein [Sphingomonas aestuarii]
MAGPSLVHRIRVEAHAVWLASRDPRTPLRAKLVGLLIAAYALSPIDLIPDFIPILGLLDEAVLIPAGVWLFERLVAPAQMAEHRMIAERASQRPKSIVGALLVIAVWASVGWFTWSIARMWWD